MERLARFFTVSELAERGLDDLPDELVSNRHLIYSSPATLAFNSPGAEGFGVKRAGLAVPGSVMLVVAPGCCGRNTSLVSSMPAYHDRFFYLTMDETDIVTGRHLRKIPQAVEEVVRGLEEPPSVVMICITCVDALLGTDMERVCRKAEERVGLPVRPCYMYALTREGRRPPMVHVRQSLYSLLGPLPKRPTSVNILGFFAPLDDGCELYRYLRQMGVKAVREIGRCRDYDEFKHMAEANFNLVLHPESRFAADDLQNRLQIPSIELTRLYQIDRIRTQYQALGRVLGVAFDDEADYAAAEAAVSAFCAAHPRVSFAVGECVNGDAFEMALALVRYGLAVREVFGTVTAENFVFVRRLAEVSPQTRVYSNMEPTMIHYDASDCPVDMALGKDAAWYHPEAARLDWNSDVQPYGYAGVKALFEALADCMASDAGEVEGAAASHEASAASVKPADTTGEELASQILAPTGAVRGLRRFLTPFAPDQSGAVSVLYELGGIVVICDAGGCTGNVCGFDEPRWHASRSAVFSAGLRDMDAILGRDDKLVNELVDASTKMDAHFAAVVGTPVPSVIGTDYRALRRMSERRGTLPTITVDTTGMELYDVGAQKAYQALFERFATDAHPVERGRVGVLGANPLELSTTSADALRAAVPGAVCYGMGSTFEDVVRASSAERNLVVAPSGLAAAKLLNQRFGTPYEVRYPLAEDMAKGLDVAGRRVLVVHQQVCANSLREALLARGASEVVCATWFMQLRELAQPQDVRLREEADFANLVADGGFDLLVGDPTLWRMVPGFEGETLDVPQFAVSGELGERA
ncbi:MAG: hypothetical protein J6D34_12040 [Atopobiaceae bacterium]|nr:hypothetical protein [Atopobiaceae bacterium]